jgi:GSH-dependent disulfide-bond oxidoreductase
MTLQFYTWSTPNGRKVSIMMEELALSYDVHPIDILVGARAGVVRGMAVPAV